MALRLPSSPTVGQIITFNNKSYTWSRKSWNMLLRQDFNL